MLKQGDIRKETFSPIPECWLDILKDLVIPLFPYIPASQNYNFHKTRTFKSSLGILQHLWS
jgi:hypothetical protein